MIIKRTQHNGNKKMKTIEEHIKIAMKDCALTDRQENALLNGLENYLAELEEVNKITFKQPVSGNEVTSK